VLFRRNKSPGEQARSAAIQRGIIQTPFGYTQFPWNIHPNDRYVRVFPDGPYSQAWEGVQRINFMSSVGTARASVYFPMANPLQTRKTKVPQLQDVNWAAYSQGAGPAVIEYQQQQAAMQAQQNQSLLSTMVRKLRGS
jgi:hypothetical protein